MAYRSPFEDPAYLARVQANHDYYDNPSRPGHQQNPTVVDTSDPDIPDGQLANTNPAMPGGQWVQYRRVAAKTAPNQQPPNGNEPPPEPGVEPPHGPGGPGLDFSAIGKTLVPEPMGFKNAMQPLQGLQAAGGGGPTPIAHSTRPEQLRSGLGQRAPASLQMLLRGKLF